MSAKRTPVFAKTQRRGVRRKKAEKAKRASQTQPFHKSIKCTAAFAASLSHQMKVHGDSHVSLFRAVVRPGEKYTDDSIRNWAAGKITPRWVTSFELLRRIERLYSLPEDHFRSTLCPESASRRAVADVTLAQQQVLRWHLPKDFDSRSTDEQQEILAWVRKNVLAGSTEYGKYLRTATQKCYSIRFPETCDIRSRKPLRPRYLLNAGGDDEDGNASMDISKLVQAPPQLAAEMDDLVRFKTATIALPGFRRYSAWSDYTAELRVRHFGLVFGSFIASPRSSVCGLGLSPSHLTLALLIVPAFWDWYLAWREKRRGFLTIFERHMMQEMMSLTRRETGWIRQHHELAMKLAPIKNFVTHKDVISAKRDWANTCDTAYGYFRERARELTQVIRVHRDPFEAIMAVLRTDSPLAEYRKIADEIMRRLPDESLDPMGAAEAIRSYLMLRFGMHLGLRQRNLRELLLCKRGSQPRSTFELETKGCGEIRWSKRDHGWEVFIPAIAFKNYQSSFFRKGPFRAILPDLKGFYAMIDGYVQRHRASLLGGYTTQDHGDYYFVFLASNSTQNLGNIQGTRFQGFDLDATARITDELSFNAGFGLTDSKITKFAGASSALVVGSKAPLVSDYTFNAGLQYIHPIWDDVSALIRIDDNLIGPTTFVIPVPAAGEPTPIARDPVNLFDLRAGVQSESWQITVWSKNLFDKKYNTEYSTGGFLFRGEPRTWGVDLTKRF